MIDLELITWLNRWQVEISADVDYAASSNGSQHEIVGLSVAWCAQLEVLHKNYDEFSVVTGLSTNVIGVPKTIDGDLKNDKVAVSFGFDTACKVYSEAVGNIMIDAASARKYWHWIRLMGRSASHITLECALQTHPQAAIILEEVAEHQQGLQSICNYVRSLSRNPPLTYRFSRHKAQQHDFHPARTSNSVTVPELKTREPHSLPRHSHRAVAFYLCQCSVNISGHHLKISPDCELSSAGAVESSIRLDQIPRTTIHRAPHSVGQRMQSVLYHISWSKPIVDWV